MVRSYLIPLVAVATLPAALDTLGVQHEADRSLAVSITSEWEFETTSFAMERDGEPVELPDGMRGGMGTVLERKLERVDSVLEAEDGVPTLVRREFVSISGERMFAEDSQQLDSPFDGLVLELSREVDEEEIEVEVVEGDEPDAEGALDGHRLGLELEALLGEGELELEDTWDLDGELLARALGIDLEQVLFPRPEREEGGERRGRGRGMRGGGGGGGNLASWFLLADWTGTARLVADDEEWEGATCLLVKLDCTGSGELPERGGFGGGRRGRSVGVPVAAAAVENGFEARLRGELLFDPALGLPVRLDVEIEYSDATRTERERGESVVVMESEHAGVLNHLVEVRVVLEEGDGE